MQKIVLFEVQQSNIAGMETGEECVTAQLRVTYASCIPCPAGGGLCQHVFAVLILLQHHVPKSPPAASLPGSDSVTSGKKLWGPRK